MPGWKRPDYEGQPASAAHILTGHPNWRYANHSNLSEPRPHGFEVPQLAASNWQDLPARKITACEQPNVLRNKKYSHIPSRVMSRPFIDVKSTRARSHGPFAKRMSQQPYLRLNSEHLALVSCVQHAP